MICSPCLSDLHEFCRDDVRSCDCDCCRWMITYEPPEDDFDDDDYDAPDNWQVGQDRYERQLHARD